MERNKESSSRNNSTVSRRNFSKIFKPTHSMKKLPEWPEISGQSIINKDPNEEDEFD